MPKETINEAIKEALCKEGKPLRVREIYNRIIEDDLYRFNASNPEHIVRTQLRRHSENLDFPTAHNTKHFTFLSDGRYWLRDTESQEVKVPRQKKIEEEPSLYTAIKELHLKYVENFKHNTLERLCQLNPYDFEVFCKKLLHVYGFKNLLVTSKSKDGGLDGHGELKIGLAYMKVAFECKRWSKSSIGRPKVSQFRGDIQGKFQQGIFFTTSKFTKEAEAASFQAGAVPIILIDGPTIVNIMIEKGFGIEVNALPTYSDAIDLILENNN